MRVKDGFILRKVGKQYVAAATGEASRNFNGMLRMNDEGAFAFELLKNDITEQALLSALLEKFGGDEAETSSGLALFLERLREADALV